jgi:hypothetical protein
MKAEVCVRGKYWHMVGGGKIYLSERQVEIMIHKLLGSVLFLKIGNIFIKLKGNKIVAKATV